MALNYGDNYVLKIKKGSVEYLVRDSIAEAAINTIQGDNKTEGSIAKALADAKSYADGLATNYDAAGAAATAEQNAKDYADGLASNYDPAGTAASAAAGVVGASTDTGDANTVYGAKTYAKGLVDEILGEDSASTTLATLKEVITELNDPANQGGITGTFVDTVKAGLAGLGETAPVYYTQEEIDAAHEGDEAYGKTVDDVKTPARPVTVKEYVDNAVSDASSSAANAIAALDAEKTSNDGNNVQIKVTEVNGKITAVNVTTDNTVNSNDVNTAITNAIQALDATPSQSAGGDGLALSLTQADGFVTGISGSIATGTYDAYGAAADVLGDSNDTASDNTVFGAKAYADGAATTAAAGVVGTASDASTANTVYGAKAYADAAITALGASSIENGVLTLAL